MKRGIIILTLLILVTSFISAETAIISFTQQPKLIYNMGDTINLPIKIIASEDFSELFQMNLICNGTYVPFYMNGITLSYGEEKNLDSSLILIKNVIGESKGICKIKAVLGGEYNISNNFRISDLLNVEANLQKMQFDSGESIAITGKVTKETGENSNGFVDVNIGDVMQYGTVIDGAFHMNISLPRDLKAGNYLMKIKASERNNNGVETNSGLLQYNISIRQVPTNLEMIIENKEVVPEVPLRVRIILHDQTGESISSTAFVTIKDSKGKTLEQKEINTDEVFEYSISGNIPPSELKILATSNKLSAEDSFSVVAKEDVNVKIMNESIVVTNIGNVRYDKTLFVKVGDTPLNIDVKLDVGESKKYILSAPDGKYNVQVSEGEKEVSEFMSLTGGTINAREIGSSYGVLAWIFLILVAGIVAFMLFRKVYKKPFSKSITTKNRREKMKEMQIINKFNAKTGNRAELSLSIKGDKQDASVICLKVKELREMKSRKGSAAETIQKIIYLTEEHKAVIYENQDYLFFILAPTKTRTFKNEKTALNLAEKIDDILTEHNKMFNQKIDFGISLDYGTIVAKIENGVFKFMSMGTLITSAKKIANLSRGEVLLSMKMNDLLRLMIRTDKHVREGVPVFSVKEIKRENEEAKKFIERFMQRQGKQ